jgi:hypothetical protein
MILSGAFFTTRRGADCHTANAADANTTCSALLHPSSGRGHLTTVNCELFLSNDEAAGFFLRRQQFPSLERGREREVAFDGLRPIGLDHVKSSFPSRDALALRCTTVTRLQ